MPITLLDAIVLAITLVSGVLAMVRGFSREVLSVVSWAAAVAAAFFFYADLVPYVHAHIGSMTVSKIVSAAIIFLATLIIVSLLTMRIADFIIDSRVGALDRTLGFIFGAARGVLLVVVAMLFFNWLVGTNQPAWIAQAKSKPLLDSLGKTLVNMLPEDSEQLIMKHLDASGGAAATDTVKGSQSGDTSGGGSQPDDASGN